MQKAEINYLADFNINLTQVREHYDRRHEISNQVKELLKNNDTDNFVNLALGISNPLGNYSANEHRLGPQILNNNSSRSVLNLANHLNNNALKINHVPKTIYDANLSYLRIGVGSEIACLLQPNKFWVCNVRTIWSHLVIKHKGNWEHANEELALYRIGDLSSEMHYQIWRDIYLSMSETLSVINNISLIWSQEQQVQAGTLKYLWVDAVCNALYEAE